MDLKFRVSAIVARPSHEVFEAVADPAKLSSYFTTGGAVGRLEEGTTVQWEFGDFPGAFPVHVVEVVPGRRIVLRWAAHEGHHDHADAMPEPAGYQNLVTFEFKPLDDDTRTLVTVAEEGWRETPAGLAGSYDNCMGWSQMVCALKVWVEHGINMRAGMYK